VLIEHQGARPQVHPSAYVAPTAVLCGDVHVSAGSRILFGAILTAEGGPVVVGRRCIVMENAVLRGSKRHPLRVGDDVLIGPRAYLSGCTVKDSVFLATGATVFNGARIEERAEVRVNGVVHLKTVVPAGTTVPIGWVAVGDPARMLPAQQHDVIWAIQRELGFSREVWGLEPAAPGQTIMPAMTERYGRALGRHLDDRIVEPLG
jgi:carbonic anhydrase/acetyltransferase-like protein (isoleucine patch superfamily)